MGQSFYLRKIPKMRAHDLLQIHMQCVYGPTLFQKLL